MQKGGPTKGMREKQKSLVSRQGHSENRGRRDLDRMDRSGDGGNGRNLRRSRSRSPIKSKLMAMAMTAGAKARAHGGQVKDKNVQRETSRDRELNKRKLRMDELSDKRSSKNMLSSHRSPDRKPSRLDTVSKKKTELDKIVKKARQERNPYWDKKVLEAEEKDPQRWGHSGFKELYQKDFKKSHGSPKRQRRSRSTSSPRRRGSPRFRKNGSRSRSRSRSRSPVHRGAKTRKESRPSFSPSPDFMSSKFKPSSGRTGAAGSMRSKKGQSDIKSKERLNGEKMKSKPVSGRDNLTMGSIKGKPLLPARGNGNGHIPMKSRLGHRVPARRSSSFSSSGSSRSRSRDFVPIHRPSGTKNSSKIKDVRGRRAGTYSDSSSSNSSDDDDVLQLHARGKGRSPSLSYSDSQSSSSSRSINRHRKGPHSSSSSSISGSSSDSDSDASIGTKPNNPVAVKKINSSNFTGVNNKQGLKKVAPTANASSVSQRSRTSANKGVVTKPKPIASDSDSSCSAGSAKLIAKPLKKSPMASVKQKAPETTKVVAKPKSAPVKEKAATVTKPAAKSASESGETESETESSSDSDSEPRMTLSERFAKLAQMSTDKREMAKPVLAVNEIDTKMRVVKDFRNPEAPKIYVTGQGATSSANANANNPTDTRTKIRPRTPEHPEGDKRYSSDERRRHFERMYRDEPAERPLDWSDARVRYNYYKDRGCFDERPITLDEYVKWEDWYQKYREWLNREEYYSRMTGPQQPGVENFSGPPHFARDRGGGGEPGSRPPNYPGGRREERMGRPTPLSNRPHFGRPQQNFPYGDEDMLGRRIDRTPGGSLVVNIRQGHHDLGHVGAGNGNGNSFGGPRGRRVGMARRR